MMDEQWSDLRIHYDTVIVATAVGAEIAPREKVPTKTGEPAVAFVAQGLLNACALYGHKHRPESVAVAVNVEMAAVLIAYLTVGFERAGVQPATLAAQVDQKRAAIKRGGFLS